MRACGPVGSCGGSGASELNIDPLVDAVVDMACFLELTGDDLLDPDLAVAQLESLAHGLSGLDPDVAARFVERLAARRSQAGSEHERQLFDALLESLPDSA